MTRQAEVVLHEASKLPEEERTEIVSALLESLGPEPDVDVEAACARRWRHGSRRWTLAGWRCPPGRRSAIAS